MAFRATGFNVEETVKRHNGTAVMTLACQNEPDIKIMTSRPSTKEVLGRIENGTMVAHPTLLLCCAMSIKHLSFVNNRMSRLQTNTCFRVHGLLKRAD